jgi:hypothetical protein
MVKIKITETDSSLSGVMVAWQVIRDGQVVANPRLNYHPALSKGAIHELIARHTEEIIAELDNPPVPPDLSDEIDQELELDSLKPVRTLEMAQSDKTDQIDDDVEHFIQRKSDGNVRYSLLGLIAMTASTISILDKLRHGNPTTEEQVALEARLDRIRETWGWVEGAFLRQVAAKQALTNLTTVQDVDAHGITLTDLEVSDPDVYLVEVWDRVGSGE